MKALRNTCKNEAVFNEIKDDAREMSALFVEASRYINFSFMKRWRENNFEPVKFQYFYFSLMKKKKSRYILDSKYEELRDKLPLYDSL